MRGRRFHLLAGLALAITACGGSDVRTSDEPSTRDSNPPPSETMPTVPEQDASLVVLLASEGTGETWMRVEVDGALLYDQSFVGSSGHDIQDLPLDLSPGSHRISVESDDGTTFDLPLELPDEDRYLIVTYWPAESEGDAPNEGAPYLSHKLVATPPGFG